MAKPPVPFVSSHSSFEERAWSWQMARVTKIGGIGGGAPDVKGGETGGPLCAGGAAAGRIIATRPRR